MASDKKYQQVIDHVNKTKAILDEVSPCFCIAKWNRSTIYLQNGTTHSCHLPAPHEIPIEEIQQNPASLHNTSHKINQRVKMFNGIRPVECSACWEIEDLATGETSDRIFKSGQESALQMLPDILKDPFSNKFAPKYLEVSFSNKCQFKCSYCRPLSSSSWEEEIKQFGAYEAHDGLSIGNIFNEDQNPYLDAFWKWWPELKKNMHTFRITGGEPLLSPSTFKILESLNSEPQSDLNINVNSNLGVPTVLFKKFNELVNSLLVNRSIKSFELFASLDTYGTQAEYIRHGLDYVLFWQNAENYLELNPNSKMTIMCTFSALSLFSFIPFLEKIMELNRKYRHSNRDIPVYLELSNLHGPDFMTIHMLPPQFISNMEQIHQFIEKNHINEKRDNGGFVGSQIIKARRTLEWMKKDIGESERYKLQKKFYQFFSEHDRRRNTNFISAFPELKEFWESCQKL